MSLAWTIIALSVLTILADIAYKRRRLHALVPPSYKPLPFVGNVFNIPSKTPWKTYAAWSKELNSDLVSLWAFGQLTVIVNSAKAARELLGKRGTNYADRPRVPTLELEGWSDSVASAMPYGETWRAHRRLLHQRFNVSVVSAYRGSQEAQARKLLRNLYIEPAGFVQHLQRFTSALSLEIAYGYEQKGDKDGLVDIVLELVDIVASTAFPGAAAVNIFPALRKLPEWVPYLAEFHRYAKRSRELFVRLHNEPYEIVKGMMAKGDAPPSVMRALLESDKEMDETEEQFVRAVSSTIYLGGAETSSSALRTLLLGLVLNPTVQTLARAEIDAVTRRERLPTFEDAGKMPYVEAVVREALRFHPILPMGIFRRAVEDDVYEGMVIPAGTTVLWNAWAITHDETTYPNPDFFNPSRHLDPSCTSPQLLPDEEKAVFGYGRRECPGIHFARNTLWIAAATMLALFEFRKAKDENGNEVGVGVEFTDGLVSHAAEFGCSIRPRDEIARAFLERMCKEM